MDPVDVDSVDVDPVEPATARPDRRFWTLFSWFAGADSRLLASCPGEVTFYRALGVAVVLTAVFSGFAACLALSYVFGVPAAHLWPVGLAWAVVIGNTDRLLIMLSTSRRRLVAVVPRVLVSLLIGILIAEPLSLRIFQPEINQQVQTTILQETHQAVADVVSFYAPRIAVDAAAVSAIRASQAQLTSEEQHYRFLADCERSETTCSSTHKLGCGPYCLHDEQLAASYAAQLKSDEPEDKLRTASLESQIAVLNRDELGEVGVAQSSSRHSDGLVAREDALVAIEAQHPGIAVLVWIVRLIFVLLDLIPILTKILHTFSGESPYEEIAAADREAERVHAYRTREHARVLRHRIGLRAKMLEDVDRMTIDAERERRIAVGIARQDTLRRQETLGRNPVPVAARVGADRLDRDGLSSDDFV